MADNEKTFGRRWRVVRTLGKGGQGVVYLVEDSGGGVFDPAALGQALNEFIRVHNNGQERVRSAKEITQVLQLLIKSENLPMAALKELLPIDEAVNAKTALERMKVEVDTITQVTHPALIRILDSKIEERWFVTEYFRNGPLSADIGRFKGRVLDALQAFRPIVEAVSELHAKRIIHRDIKPENVFIADDGHLVLGDCGLAIKMEKQDRLTLTYENVGTRDYQPPWTYTMRLEDVKPNFDVFSLGKLLWAMVSGKPRFPLEDFDIEPHDLRKMFPDNPDTLFIHQLMTKCVVRREAQCVLPDATALINEVDTIIQAVSAGAVVPNKAGMRCRFCGIGSYNEVDNFTATGDSMHGQNNHFFVCSHCGHLEMFAYLGNNTPKAWK